MKQNEISFLDAKNSCMKKIKTNPKVKSVQTTKSALFVSPRGANTRFKISFYKG
jgi:hypothetical protein